VFFLDVDSLEANTGLLRDLADLLVKPHKSGQGARRRRTYRTRRGSEETEDFSPPSIASRRWNIKPTRERALTAEAIRHAKDFGSCISTPP